MTESTARADRYDLQTSTSPFYTWEVSQKQVSVRIPHNLMDRLEHEAVENFRSLSSRGSEIGGLLIGSVTPGSPMIVSLADYELIPCDYSRGPLYRLSEADIARFERAMQQRLNGGMGVAGFFRSQTRKGMSLDADDLAFFEQRFREPHQIALLVRPYATKASTAAIFIREGGKINGESSLLEFPFRSSELGPVKSAPAVAESSPRPLPAPAAPKPAGRAQIVPIAPRREPVVVPELPAPAAFAPEPPVAQAPAAAPPATDQAKPVTPAAATPSKSAAPPAPVKTAVASAPAAPAVEEKPSKNDKLVKDDKPAAKDEKSATTAPPAAKSTVAEQPAPTAKTALEVEPAPRSNKMVKLVLAAAASIALFVVLFVYPGLMRNSGKPSSAAHPDTSGLQLRVERTAGELLLTWNRDSDAIRSATKAVLLITDGEQQENVELDLAQLRNGSIVYSPSGADISFKMEVTGRGQTKVASESVRVLRTRPSPMDQTQPTAQNDQSGLKPANGIVPAVGSITPATPAQDNPPQEEIKPAAPATPLKPFKAEPLAQRLRPVTTADIPDAPTVAGGGATPTTIPGMNLNAGMAAPAAPQAPSPAPPAVPVTTQQVTTPVKSGGQIQQATLIYKKDPEYPKIAKQTGAKGQVKLVATIGKDGRVKGVKVVSGHPMLQNAAMDAVRQWIYKPTMLNGAPVETETEILVNFLGER